MMPQSLRELIKEFRRWNKETRRGGVLVQWVVEGKKEMRKREVW